MLICSVANQLQENLFHKVIILISGGVISPNLPGRYAEGLLANEYVFVYLYQRCACSTDDYWWACSINEQQLAGARQYHDA